MIFQGVLTNYTTSSILMHLKYTGFFVVRIQK